MTTGSAFLIAVSASAVSVVFCLAVFLVLRKSRVQPQADASMRLLAEFQREIQALHGAMKDQSVQLSRQVNEQMRENTRFLQESHLGYSSAVNHIQHRLGELQEATQAMTVIGRDIASLQDILRSPKLRGGLGEFLLADLLQQILPENHFSLQYGFSGGAKVDAVIRLGEGLIPVDAKFPLENFRRMMETSEEPAVLAARKQFKIDVKRHIDCIASKYILPEEGTFEFALMYIPAENVYYETIIKDTGGNDSLAQYALEKRVIPVSPNSFYAYLQSIVHGLKGLRIERSARIILQSLGQIETDFQKCIEEFEKVGMHLSHTRSAYERAEKRLEKLQDKVASLEKHDTEAGLVSGEKKAGFETVS